MYRKQISKAIWGFFCASLLCLQLPCQAKTAEQFTSASGSVAPEELELHAISAVLLDAESGRVLYNKNADSIMAMASTTKIMTCIMVLENVDIEETASVSAYAASMPKVKLSIQKGENYSVKDLLYSLMLESHNDSAVALAEHVGKRFLSKELQEKSCSEYTVEESKLAVKSFCRLMTSKARELGCENTYFITPNGLDATETFELSEGETLQKEHSTTATELARIMAYCVKGSPKKEQFLEITRTNTYSFYANNRSYSCQNHNAFLQMMPGVISGKTGFTNKAGYCYVTALEEGDRCFVVALLACGWPNNKTYKWSDTKKLLQYGLAHFVRKDFLEPGVLYDADRLPEISVLEGQTKTLGREAYVNVEIVGREEIVGKRMGIMLGPGERIDTAFQCKEKLYAPVDKGTVVGEIQYKVGEETYRTEQIVTCEEVKKVDLEWCLKSILERFFKVFRNM